MSGGREKDDVGTTLPVVLDYPHEGRPDGDVAVRELRLGRRGRKG